jgi:metal-responsive CopG/Arc/MetJ family transcriptional regulator
MQTQTFNIALPVDLVTRMDIVAREEYRNRSELIREAIRTYLDRIDSWERIFAAGQKVAQKMGITSEEQVNKIVLEYRHGRGKKKSSA